MTLNNNSVSLLGYYGGDKRVCLSAWQSTTEELGIELPENILDRVDVIFNHIAQSKKKSSVELLSFLAANNHQCYDEETEILTSSGWKYFRDLISRDMVCTVDINSRSCHFEIPKQIYSGSYDEPMYYVKGQQLDLAVTKGHRMVVSRKQLADGSDYGNNWEFETPEQINGKTRKYLKSAQLKNLDYFEDENFAKLVGFFIGDGTYGSANTIKFHLRKSHKIKYLYSLGFKINNTNDNYYVQLSDNNGVWFKKNCYTQEGDKKLPDNYLEFSNKDVTGILDGLKNSDGTKKHSSWEYATTSEILADQLITLSALHNFVFTKSTTNKISNFTQKPLTLYRLGFSKRVDPEISTMKSRKIGEQYWKHYTGMIYCVTVSTGAVLIRRNGHICVSGNTPFEKAILDFQLTGDLASHIHCLKHRLSAVNSECLTGDAEITFVNINGASSTKSRFLIKELYDKWNNGQHHQNTEKDKLYSQSRIKKMKLRVLNEKTGVFQISCIKDIWHKGVQDVYQITLENGHKLKCTDNHLLFTKDGYKSINSGLSIDSFVGCNGISIEVEGKAWTYSDFYKDANNYTRKEFAEKHDLKYELIKKWGYMFKVDENKDFKKGITPWNKEHNGYKLKNPERRIGEKFSVHYSKVESIIYVGKEETYDIEVEGEYNNFIANKIVVHNSARYKEFQQDKYYLPEDWKDIKCSSNIEFEDKVESVSVDIGLKYQDWTTILDDYSKLGFQLYHQALKDLTPKLGRKRAKESARYFLGYNTQLNFDWQMNFRSFVNIQQLRNDKHAQKEIHFLANTMLYLVENIEGNPFKYCLEAFNLKHDPEYLIN